MARHNIRCLLKADLSNFHAKPKNNCGVVRGAAPPPSPPPAPHPSPPPPPPAPPAPPGSPKWELVETTTAPVIGPDHPDVVKHSIYAGFETGPSVVFSVFLDLLLEGASREQEVCVCVCVCVCERERERESIDQSPTLFILYFLMLTLLLLIPTMSHDVTVCTSFNTGQYFELNGTFYYTANE